MFLLLEAPSIVITEVWWNGPYSGTIIADEKAIVDYKSSGAKIVKVYSSEEQDMANKDLATLSKKAISQRVPKEYALAEVKDSDLELLLKT